MFGGDVGEDVEDVKDTELTTREDLKIEIEDSDEDQVLFCFN